MDPQVYTKPRTATFTLRSGNVTKEFTLTQYPPIRITMPRFDEQGNQTGKTETFWVEAVDRYAMPWGFVNENFDGQHTSGVYSMDNMKMLIRDYREACLSYMPYGTANGGSAMMMATWNDCMTFNTGTPNENFNPYNDSYLIQLTVKNWDGILNGEVTDRKYHYSIPSIVEWQYIEKAIKAGQIDIGPNAKDENCRINPAAEYWTSNHAMDFPGESYTYQIGRGLDELKKGQDEYIYHRNRNTALRYRMILTKAPNSTQWP